MKIVFPNLKVTLIDALNKRIKFLDDVIDKLNLTNIETIHCRSEDYGIKNREKFDIVTARAVANLPVLMELCVPLVKKNGYFIPLKANIQDELIISSSAIKTLKLTIDDKIYFKLPIEDSNRAIIKFKKLEKTNVKFPRKYSDIKKKPL